MPTDIFKLIREGTSREMAEHLQKNPSDVHLKDAKGRTPLHHAASMGRTTLVQLLLAQGADANAEENAGYLPINGAVWDGYLEVIELLMVSLNMNSDGARALMTMAAERGHERILELAIQNGAAVDSDDGFGQTPLLYAVRGEQISTVKLLIANGANVNHQRDGETPISLAKDNPEISKLLIAAGGIVPQKKLKPIRLKTLKISAKDLLAAKKKTS